MFGVAKFSDQPGFGPPDAGRTIASIRAVGARWNGLSHGGTPEGVCYISQSQVSFLSTGRVFSPFMLADTPQRKGRAGEVIDRIRRAQTRPNLLADRQMAATFLAPGTFFPMRPYYSSAAFMTAWSRPCAAATS